MKIIFDTNILHEDFFLKRAQIVDICETARKYNIDVYIPEVVYDEIVNQYREKIEKAQSDIDSALDKIRGVSPKLQFENPINEELKNEVLQDYPPILDKRLKELNIKILPYPTISHKEVVARDLKRRRPFQNSGKGYRDALIWETILRIIEKRDDNPDVVFINKNTHDFCEKKELHPDLKDDLLLKGLTCESLKIYDNLKDAIDAHIRPLQNRLQDLLNKYSEKSTIGNIDINEYLINKIDTDIKRILDDDENVYLLGVDSHIEEPEFIELRDVKASIKDIHHLSSDQIIVDVDAEVLVDIEGYLFKADYYALSEDRVPTIIDPNWNRHYMLVWDTIKFPVQISLVVDSELSKVLNHSIEAY